MMKLILSLTLIWTLSSTAEALQCWQGLGNTKESLPCNATQRCATVAIHGYHNGAIVKLTRRSCEPSSFFSEGQHTYSINDGSGALFASVHVCNTDDCNKQDMPYPALQEKNNLTCFGCMDEKMNFNSQCRNTAQCFGQMDRCINSTADDGQGTRFYQYACVSANYCEVLSHVENLVPGGVGKILQPTKCCGSNFCNSAWSVKLNMITLLCGLITLIFY